MLKRWVNKLMSIKREDIWIFFVIMLVFINSYVVYLVGGTESSFTHLMYIPISIAAFLGGIKGAFGAALIGGIAIGPFMYKSVSDKIIQEPSVWIFRTVMFIVVGIVIGGLFQYIRRTKRIEIENSFKSQITGLPNINKLKKDMIEKISKKKSFSLIVFKIVNIDEINTYIDYSIGGKSLLKASQILKNVVNEQDVYSICINELAVIMPEGNIEDTYRKGLEYINMFKEPISVQGLSISLTIKGAIVNYPLHGNDSNDLFKKASIALNEECDKSDIFIYDFSIEKNHREKYEIMLSLYDALKNDEFYIVYHPKIGLHNNKVMGAEALIRWNRGIQGETYPEEFIKIAEDVGIISEITKWVIKNTIFQMEKWRQEGIIVKVAINISSKDLKNNSVMEFTKRCIKQSGIDPKNLEFELTERGIIENESMVKYLLNDVKKYGLKFSLDDFGTGYNSLINLIKLPIDYIKIDKFFIDNIDDEDCKVLIESIINTAHKRGKEIIAEGVEKKEQVEVLSRMDCDQIQGYYFSKPLPPEKLKEYILNYA